MMKVNNNLCIGCGKCVKECFPKFIKISDNKAKIRDKPCLKCGHCIAVCPVNAISMDDYDMSEVIEYEKETFDIAPEKLLNFIKFRRSIRQFKPTDVENEKLLKIIEAGRFTQTSINMQDVSYTVVKDVLPNLKEIVYTTLKDIGENILSNPNENNAVLKRYAPMWINMHKEYHENQKENDKLFFNAPSIIVVSASAAINGALASSNMELMTNALGLGTFFSGFFVRAANANPEIQKFLCIPEDKSIISCMVIGYPNVTYKRTVPRKAAEINWK